MFINVLFCVLNSDKKICFSLKRPHSAPMTTAYQFVSPVKMCSRRTAYLLAFILLIFFFVSLFQHYHTDFNAVIKPTMKRASVQLVRLENTTALSIMDNLNCANLH